MILMSLEQANACITCILHIYYTLTLAHLVFLFELLLVAAVVVSNCLKF